MSNISDIVINLSVQSGSNSNYLLYKEPLSENDLCSIEANLNCALPLDYREFLQKFGRENTGLYCRFNYEHNGELKPRSISLLYGFYSDITTKGYERNRDIIAINIDFEPEKSDDVLCIGDDPGGYQICLCIHGDNYGHVYFWDRGKAWEAESVEDLDLIATSFEAFISKLQIVH